MQPRVWLMLGGLSLTFGGCASTPDTATSCRPDVYSLRSGPQAGLAPALLFDRKPGPFCASDFAYRSDWPSTVSYYSPSQAIYFRERFADYQGRGFGQSDLTYRLFETYRVGAGYR